MILDAILREVRKTNPDMTMEKLINELFKSTSSGKALAMKIKNQGKIF